MAKRWYVVHAYSGFEHQVKRSLEERIARAGVEDLARVTGVSRKLAQTIYDSFRDGT